jgi:hypothetical protein
MVSVKNSINTPPNMKKLLFTAGLATALTAASATNSLAEVSLFKNDKVEVLADGYLGVSATITEYENDGKKTKSDAQIANGASNLDAAKLGVKVVGGGATAYVSGIYSPGSTGSGLYALDAYLSYEFSGITFTAGKFLTYLGYESFYIPSMDQLTYGPAVGIPAYHSGIKADYSIPLGGKDSKESVAFGFAVLDSLGGGDNYAGDGKLNHIAFEACVTYVGLGGDLTVFAGLGYDSGNEAGTLWFAEDPDDEDTAYFAFNSKSEVVFDLWASYQLNEKLKVAAEFSYHNLEYNGLGHDERVALLLFGQYTISDKISAVVRGGATLHDNSIGHQVQWQATIAPTYKVSDYLRFRAELTYYTGGSKTFGDGYGYNESGHRTRNGIFLGAQAVFSF